MKAVVNGNQQEAVVVWPCGLDSPSLGTVNEPGTLQQSSEVVIAWCHIEITKKNEGFRQTDVVRESLELVVPPTGICGTRGRQRMCCNDSKLVLSNIDGGYN